MAQQGETAVLVPAEPPAAAAESSAMSAANAAAGYVAALEAECARLREEVSACRNQITANREQQAATHDYETLQAEHDVALRRVTSLERELQQALTANTKAAEFASPLLSPRPTVAPLPPLTETEDVTQLRLIIQSQEATIGKLDGMGKRLAAQADEALDKFVTADAECQHLRAKVESVRQETMDSQAALRVDLERRLSESEAARRATEERAIRFAEQAESALDQLTQTETERDTAVAALQASSDATRIQTLETQLAEARASLAHHTDMVKELEQRARKLASQAEEAIDQLVEVEDERDKLRAAAVEAADAKDLRAQLAQAAAKNAQQAKGIAQLEQMSQRLLGRMEEAADKTQHAEQEAERMEIELEYARREIAQHEATIKALNDELSETYDSIEDFRNALVANQNKTDGVTIPAALEEAVDRRRSTELQRLRDDLDATTEKLRRQSVSTAQVEATCKRLLLQAEEAIDGLVAAEEERDAAQAGVAQRDAMLLEMRRKLEDAQDLIARLREKLITNAGKGGQSDFDEMVANVHAKRHALAIKQLGEVSARLSQHHLELSAKLQESEAEYAARQAELQAAHDAVVTRDAQLKAQEQQLAAAAAQIKQLNGLLVLRERDLVAARVETEAQFSARKATRDALERTGKQTAARRHMTEMRRIVAGDAAGAPAQAETEAPPASAAADRGSPVHMAPVVVVPPPASEARETVRARAHSDVESMVSDRRRTRHAQHQLEQQGGSAEATPTGSSVETPLGSTMDDRLAEVEAARAAAENELAMLRMRPDVRRMLEHAAEAAKETMLDALCDAQDADDEAAAVQRADAEVQRLLREIAHLRDAVAVATRETRRANKERLAAEEALRQLYASARSLAGQGGAVDPLEAPTVQGQAEAVAQVLATSTLARARGSAVRDEEQYAELEAMITTLFVDIAAARASQGSPRPVLPAMAQQVSRHARAVLKLERLRALFADVNAEHAEVVAALRAQVEDMPKLVQALGNMKLLLLEHKSRIQRSEEELDELENADQDAASLADGLRALRELSERLSAAQAEARRRMTEQVTALQEQALSEVQAGTTASVELLAMMKEQLLDSYASLAEATHDSEEDPHESATHPMHVTRELEAVALRLSTARRQAKGSPSAGETNATSVAAVPSELLAALKEHLLDVMAARDDDENEDDEAPHEIVDDHEAARLLGELATSLSLSRSAAVRQAAAAKELVLDAAVARQAEDDAAPGSPVSVRARDSEDRLGLEMAGLKANLLNRLAERQKEGTRAAESSSEIDRLTGACADLRALNERLAGEIQHSRAEMARLKADHAAAQKDSDEGLTQLGEALAQRRALSDRLAAELTALQAKVAAGNGSTTGAATTSEEEKPVQVVAEADRTAAPVPKVETEASANAAPTTPVISATTTPAATPTPTAAGTPRTDGRIKELEAEVARLRAEAAEDAETLGDAQSLLASQKAALERVTAELSSTRAAAAAAKESDATLIAAEAQRVVALEEQVRVLTQRKSTLESDVAEIRAEKDALSSPAKRDDMLRTHFASVQLLEQSMKDMREMNSKLHAEIADARAGKDADTALIAQLRNEAAASKPAGDASSSSNEFDVLKEALLDALAERQEIEHDAHAGGDPHGAPSEEILAASVATMEDLVARLRASRRIDSVGQGAGAKMEHTLDEASVPALELLKEQLLDGYRVRAVLGGDDSTHDAHGGSTEAVLAASVATMEGLVAALGNRSGVDEAMASGLKEALLDTFRARQADAASDSDAHHGSAEGQLAASVVAMEQLTAGLRARVTADAAQIAALKTSFLDTLAAKQADRERAAEASEHTPEAPASPMLLHDAGRQRAVAVEAPRVEATHVRVEPERHAASAQPAATGPSAAAALQARVDELTQQKDEAEARLAMVEAQAGATAALMARHEADRAAVAESVKQQQGTIKELQAQMGALRVELDAARDSLVAAEREAAEERRAHEGRLADVSAKRTALQEAVAQLEGRSKEHEAQLVAAREQEAAASKRATEAEALRKEASARDEDSQKSLASLREELDKQRAAATAAATRRKEQEESQRTLKESLKDANVERDSLRTAHEATMARAAALEARLEAFESNTAAADLDEARRQLKAAEEREAVATTQLADAQAQLLRQQTQLQASAAVAEQLAEAEADLKAARERLNAAEDSAQAANQRVRELQAAADGDTQGLQARLVEQARTQTALTGSLDALKAELLAVSAARQAAVERAAGLEKEVAARRSGEEAALQAVSAAEAALAQARKAAAASEARLTQLSSATAQSLNESMEALAEAEAATERDVGDARRRLLVALARNAELEADAEGLRTQLAAAERANESDEDAREAAAAAASAAGGSGDAHTCDKQLRALKRQWAALNRAHDAIKQRTVAAAAQAPEGEQTLVLRQREAAVTATYTQVFTHIEEIRLLLVDATEEALRDENASPVRRAPTSTLADTPTSNNRGFRDLRSPNGATYSGGVWSPNAGSPTPGGSSSGAAAGKGWDAERAALLEKAVSDAQSARRSLSTAEQAWQTERNNLRKIVADQTRALADVEAETARSAEELAAVRESLHDMAARQQGATEAWEQERERLQAEIMQARAEAALVRRQLENEMAVFKEENDRALESRTFLASQIATLEEERERISLSPGNSLSTLPASATAFHGLQWEEALELLSAQNTVLRQLVSAWATAHLRRDSDMGHELGTQLAQLKTMLTRLRTATDV